MNDLIAGTADLSTMQSGGVRWVFIRRCAGAGGGWAGRVLHRADLRQQVEDFSLGLIRSRWVCAMDANVGFAQPLDSWRPSWRD